MLKLSKNFNMSSVHMSTFLLEVDQSTCFLFNQKCSFAIKILPFFELSRHNDNCTIHDFALCRIQWIFVHPPLKKFCQPCIWQKQNWQSGSKAGMAIHCISHSPWTLRGTKLCERCNEFIHTMAEQWSVQSPLCCPQGRGTIEELWGDREMGLRWVGWGRYYGNKWCFIWGWETMGDGIKLRKEKEM